nr:hypothetical protein [Tanacetum cinerariifolium]
MISISLGELSYLLSICASREKPPDALIPDDIRNALDYSDYLELVAKDDKRVAAEAVGPSAPKTKVAKETPDEPSPAKRLKGGLVGKRRKPKSPLKLVDGFADEDQYILQKCTPETVEPTGPSFQPEDEGITMTNNETESDKIVTPVNKEDLPEANMKNILPQRIWETGSYKTHKDHTNLYKALEKSMDRDPLDQLQGDLAEARKKCQKRSDSPRTPTGSPPPPPPCSPGASGALDSTQPPVATHQPSNWTILDTRDKPSGSSVRHLSPPEDQQMNDDPVPADEEHTSSDDDLGIVLKVSSHKDWWKPHDDDDRPATPEPTWVIPHSRYYE